MNIPIKLHTPELDEQERIAGGWSDHRTKSAHMDLEALLNRLDPESDAASLCFQLMEEIEALDCSLPKGEW